MSSQRGQHCIRAPLFVLEERRERVQDVDGLIICERITLAFLIFRHLKRTLTTGVSKFRGLNLQAKGVPVLFFPFLYFSFFFLAPHSSLATERGLCCSVALGRDHVGLMEQRAKLAQAEATCHAKVC